MAEFMITLDSELDTGRLGTLLAKIIPDGTTVNLRGTLGAGKTRLVQAIAESVGVDREQVTSPTFVLCQHYTGSRRIHHLDAYRIKDEDEFYEIGGHELIDSDALTLIEWGDRVAACLPDERLEIEIEVTGETQRQFRLVSFGSAMERAVNDCKQAWPRE